jgi:hypothetical protein
MRGWPIGGVIAGAALAALLMPVAVESLDHLAQLHAARAANAAQAASPAPDTADLRLPSGSAARGAALLVARVRRVAGSNGVLVERAGAGKPLSPGIAEVDVALSGSEKAVLSVADAIEREMPGTRWRTWRIAAMPGGAVRFQGEAAVAWR